MAISPSRSASTSYSTSLEVTSTLQKSQGAPHPLPPHMRKLTARRKVATLNRWDRGSCSDAVSPAGADPFMPRWLMAVLGALCHLPTMLRVRRLGKSSKGGYGRLRPASPSHQFFKSGPRGAGCDCKEFLAPASASAMLLILELKYIRKFDLRGLSVARSLCQAGLEISVMVSIGASSGVARRHGTRQHPGELPTAGHLHGAVCPCRGRSGRVVSPYVPDALAGSIEPVLNSTRPSHRSESSVWHRRAGHNLFGVG
jgi:hypothetical protein